MRLTGYFVLGGTGNPPALPFTGVASGNHTGARARGQFVIDTDLESHTVNIPSRDKTVTSWMSQDGQLIATRLATLDAEPGPNYRTKLISLFEDLPDLFGALVNVSTSTHGSIALVGEQVRYYGLYDQQSDTSYLLWGAESDLHTLQRMYPLRYLVYRFPPMRVVFLPGEVICSKWWRWTRNASLLNAFNALEMRLNNGPSG